MSKKHFVSILLALSILGFLLIFLLFKIPNKKNDIIQLNRIYQEVTLHIDSPSNGDYTTITYPFAILDTAGNVIFQRGKSPDTTMSLALKNGDTIRAITRNNMVIATLIITTTPSASFYRMRSSAVLLMLATLLLSITLLVIYFIHIQRDIVRPCQQMQVFSNDIASGNLDFALPIAKNNLFGSFTESFDLMREELAHAKQQEYLANQSKKELVASLSHDIKTPITSIQLMTELLLVTTKEDITRQKLLTISQKTEQINNLVTDLFHATLEDLEELRVNIQEVYSASLESMIMECDSNDLISLSPIPDCILTIDPIRLRQVFSNIIYNSFKYAKSSIKISFALNETHLEVHIQDFGPGVLDDDLPLIFNKFYRGKNSVNESGSGLGLYICKMLLSQMKSEIYCSNNEEGFETLILLKLA